MGLKTVLSMSVSGSLLILVLLAGKRFLKDKLSRQWQYYIWLVVILRLLLPFGAEIRLPGPIDQTMEQTVTQAMPFQQPATDSVPDSPPPENTEHIAEFLPVEDMIALIWLAGVLATLIRKITLYQSFTRYVHSGSTPVSDVALLDRLAAVVEEMNVRKPVELCVNPLISSPLLIGFFRPCVVLPSAGISEKNFRYTVLHELTHYRRQDMVYKWLAQFTVCLHWFNPLVHLMSREMTRACEFSCDEAVLSRVGCDRARDYGSTLLDAMAAVGKYKESAVTVPFSENKQELRERITTIMNFKKKTPKVRLLTGVLTLCMLFAASFIGVSTADAADVKKSGDLPAIGTMNVKGTTYYLISSEEQLRAIGTGQYSMDANYIQQADIQLSADEWVPIGTWDKPFTGSFNGNGFKIRGLTMTDPKAKIIGLFGVAKNAHIYNVTLRDYDIMTAGRNVSGKSVGAILAVGQGSRSHDNAAYPKDTSETPAEKYYEAGSLPLFGIAFSRLDGEAQETLLNRIYEDGKISFFSIAANYLDEDALEDWLDRAVEDKKWNFQSMLFDKLDWEDEWDELKDEKEKEWAEAQTAEYKAAGVTMDGKNYYYKGQLVNIFLDIRPNKSFYTLDVNPAGTVNIKIVRNEKNQIAKVTYMTEAEVEELLEDMRDDDDEPEVIPVDLKSAADGEIVWLGEYTLSEGARVKYDVSAKTGNKMQVGFVKAGDKKLNTTYYSILNQRTDGKLEIKADFTVGSPVESGTYYLFLRGLDGALSGVQGNISIAFAE